MHKATVTIISNNKKSNTATSKQQARNIAMRAQQYNKNAVLTATQQKTVNAIIKTLTHINSYTHFVNIRKTKVNIKYCISFKNMLSVARIAKQKLLAANISATIEEKDTGLIVNLI